MATRPKTNQEALQQIKVKQDKIRDELKTALSKQDSNTAKKLYDELGMLEAQKRSMVVLGGVPIGAMAAGLQGGVVGAATFPLDAATMLRNFAMGEKNQMPSAFLGGLFREYTGAPSLNTLTEPASEESAVPFRAAQGFGSAIGPGGSVKMLLTQAGLGAADALMGDEGMLQLGFGAAQLGLGGFKALKGLRDNSRMKEFVKGLPSNEQNAFSKFMATGQGSDDPMVNAAFQRLSTDPKYSEIFAKLRKGATEASTAGMQPAASKLTEAEAATGAITGIAAKIKGLKEQMTEGPKKAFERAYGYAGDKPLVSPTNTLENIRRLKAQFAAKGSPDSEKAVTLLQQLEDKLSPKGAIPSSPGTTADAQRLVTGMDAAGMPTTSTVPMTVNVPGARGYTFGYGEKKMTVPEIQGWLSEFGAKAASGDSLFPELSLSAQERIMKTVFGSLKDDLRLSVGGADDVLDRKAITSLMEARKTTEQAATTYNNAIAQGLPAWMKTKPLNTIAPEELFAEYGKLNKTQRDVVRGYLNDVDPESLKFIDRKVYDDFVASAQGKNPDGTFGTSLEKLAGNWRTLKAADKDAITQALGTNADEFDKRMKDAEVFTRRMQVRQPITEELIPSDKIGSVEAATGAVAGYAPAKGIRTALQTINVFGEKPFGGLSDEQLMKVLLTNEGKDFLKQGKLSGNSAKTLEALTRVDSAAIPTYIGSKLLLQQQQRPGEPPAAPSISISPEDIVMDEEPSAQSTEPMQPQTGQPAQSSPITISESDLVFD